MEMVVRKLRELDQGRLVLTDLIRLRATRTEVIRLSESVKVKKNDLTTFQENKRAHIFVTEGPLLTCVTAQRGHAGTN